MLKVTYDTKQFYKPYIRLSQDKFNELQNQDLEYTSGERVPLEGTEKVKQIVVDMKPSYTEEAESLPIHFVGPYLILTPEQRQKLSGIIDNLSVLGDLMDVYHNEDIDEAQREFIESHFEVRLGLVDNRVNIPGEITYLLEESLKQKKSA